MPEYACKQPQKELTRRSHDVSMSRECKYCPRPAEPGGNGVMQVTCGRDKCKRKQQAEYQARYRARQRGDYIEPEEAYEHVDPLASLIEGPDIEPVSWSAVADCGCGCGGKQGRCQRFADHDFTKVQQVVWQPIEAAPLPADWRSPWAIRDDFSGLSNDELLELRKHWRKHSAEDEYRAAVAAITAEIQKRARAQYH